MVNASTATEAHSQSHLKGVRHIIGLEGLIGSYENEFAK